LDRPNATRLDRWVLGYLRHAPLSLCVREVNRLIALEALQARHRVPGGTTLDVGCGDAFWWTLLDHADQQVYGIDISAAELRLASSRIRVRLCDVSTERPFPDREFAEVIGNCSLEHVRDIDAALQQIHAAAAPGAHLVLFVPARDWAYQGLTQGFLLRHSPRLAMALSGALNGFFQHWHLYDIKVWTRIIEANGWKVTDRLGLGSARSELLFRAGLPEAFMEFLVKCVTGHYPAALLRCVPEAWLLLHRRLLKWALADALVSADSPKAYEYAIVARPA
jgi:SAM-dependent methyltransferase